MADPLTEVKDATPIFEEYNLIDAAVFHKSNAVVLFKSPRILQLTEEKMKTVKDFLIKNPQLSSTKRNHIFMELDSC